jgi:elongation factor P
MALLKYNEIKERSYIIYEGVPYEVLSAHVARTQQRKPQNQVKMKSLIDGRGVNATFRSSDTVEQADIVKRDAKYLYQKRGEFCFCDPKNPGDRFMLNEEVISENTLRFLKVDEIAQLLIFDYQDEEQIIGVSLPMKMDFIVSEAPPNIKGDTATGGNKVVTLENGTTVSAPLFINTGDTIRVNTETGEYVERVEKN